MTGCVLVLSGEIWVLGIKCHITSSTLGAAGIVCIDLCRQQRVGSSCSDSEQQQRVCVLTCTVEQCLMTNTGTHKPVALNAFLHALVCK